MSKLYFLVPDINLADRILSAVKARDIPEANIGVIASDQSCVEQVPETDLRSCFKITQLAQYGVKNRLKMLIYSM
jgi:hypothetical protein